MYEKNSYLCTQKKRGDESPLIFCNDMIQKEQITTAVGSYFQGKPMFLVDVTISKDNDIDVIIDSDEKDICLDDCVLLSRYLETALDRDKEDFALTVGSAGLTSPLTVLRQYRKFIEKEVEVTMKNGSRIKGILISAEPEQITVKHKISEKVEGQKKKKVEEVIDTFALKELKSTKPVIRFNK